MHLDYANKSSIVDLGAGQGSLIKPHIGNKSLRKIAIEINEEVKNKLQSLYDEVLIGNLITSKVLDLVENFPTEVIYVSNPPFGCVNYSSEIEQLLFSQGLFLNSRPVKTFRIELVFIARVLELASIGDEAVFIIPRSILESTDFRSVRDTLCKKHNLHSCLLLSEKTFKNTEVRTAIIWFKPYAMVSEKAIKIFQAENQLLRSIDCNDFIERGISPVNFTSLKGTKLSSLILSIKRGKSTKRSLINRNIEHIHTTDLNRQHAQVIHNLKENNKVIESSKENVAQDGDILIARVGTRVLGKAAIFSGNETVISDCVFRLRVADSDRNSIFKKLVSEKGQEWLKSVATGSCARVLTYDAINNFPLAL
jgi:type I restriction enzyme M protein